jgi:hypothetical protein
MDDVKRKKPSVFDGTSLPKPIRKVAKKEMNRLGEGLVIRAELARIFLSLKTVASPEFDKTLFVSKEQEQQAALDTFVDAGERIIEMIRK